MGDHEQIAWKRCKKCVYWLAGRYDGHCYLDLQPGKTCRSYTPLKTGPQVTPPWPSAEEPE